MTPEKQQALSRRVAKVLELLGNYAKEPAQPEVKIPIREAKDAAVNTAIKWLVDIKKELDTVEA